MRRSYGELKKNITTKTEGLPELSLLFLLFINDVVDLFFGAVNVKLYADDIKIYLEIVDDADIAQLQMGLPACLLGPIHWS